VTVKAAEIPAASEFSGGTSPICAFKTPYHHPLRRVRAMADTHKGRTIMLGLIGMIIAAGFFGVADTAGIDWIRWILSIIAAIVAISIYLSVTGKKN